MWRVVVQERAAIGPRADVVTLHEWTPRPRAASWIVVLYREERRVFDSRKLELAVETERAARWLATLVRMASEAGVLATGGTPTHRPPMAWTDVAHDSVAQHGAWGVAVAAARDGYEVTLHGPHPIALGAVAPEVRVRTRGAGRFLGELMLDLAAAGHAIPST